MLLSLEQLQQQNKERAAEVEVLLSSLHKVLETTINEQIVESKSLENIQQEVKQLKEEKVTLTDTITELKRKETSLLQSENLEAKQLEEKLKTLKRSINNAQEAYSDEVWKRNAVADEIAENKQELKEKELSLTAKVNAFIKEKQEFDLEKRRFRAKVSQYDGIL